LKGWPKRGASGHPSSRPSPVRTSSRPFDLQTRTLQSFERPDSLLMICMRATVKLLVVRNSPSLRPGTSGSWRISDARGKPRPTERILVLHRRVAETIVVKSMTGPCGDGMDGAGAGTRHQHTAAATTCFCAATPGQHYRYAGATWILPSEVERCLRVLDGAVAVFAPWGGGGPVARTRCGCSRQVRSRASPHQQVLPPWADPGR